MKVITKSNLKKYEYPKYIAHTDSGVRKISLLLLLFSTFIQVLLLIFIVFISENLLFGDYASVILIGIHNSKNKYSMLNGDDFVDFYKQ